MEAGPGRTELSAFSAAKKGGSGRNIAIEAELRVQSVVRRLHGSRTVRSSQEGLQMRSRSMTRDWKIMSRPVKGVRVLCFDEAAGLPRYHEDQQT